MNEKDKIKIQQACKQFRLSSGFDHILIVGYSDLPDEKIDGLVSLYGASHQSIMELGALVCEHETMGGVVRLLLALEDKGQGLFHKSIPDVVM